MGSPHYSTSSRVTTNWPAKILFLPINYWSTVFKVKGVLCESQKIKMHCRQAQWCWNDFFVEFCYENLKKLSHSIQLLLVLLQGDKLVSSLTDCIIAPEQTKVCVCAVFQSVENRFESRYVSKFLSRRNQERKRKSIFIVELITLQKQRVLQMYYIQ